MEGLFKMRILVLCACGFLAAPALSFAEDPPPDARALGAAEAIVSYCAKIDPSAAAKYQQHVKLIAKNASEEVLAKVRQSSEYQQARDTVDESVGKLDEREAKRACSASLSSGK
jgi:hypothetical protein